MSTSALLPVADQPEATRTTSFAPASNPLFGALLILGLWLFIANSILSMADTTYRLILLLAILTALLLPLFYRQINNDLDMFEPLVFANLSLGSMFLGRPLFDMGANHWYFERIDVKPGFENMLEIAFIGIVTFQIGYLSRVPDYFAARLPGFPEDIDYKKAARLANTLFLIGLVLYGGYVITSGGIGFLIASLISRNLEAQGYSFKTGSGYLAIGNLLWPPAAFILYSCWLKLREKKYLYLSFLMMISFLITTLGSGSRSIILQGLLGMMIIHFIGTNTRPKFYLVLPALVLGIFFLVGARQTRNSDKASDKIIALQAVIENPKDAILSIWSEDDAAMPDYFSVMIYNIPSRIPFAHGSVIKDCLTRAYPRFLWPNHVKPDEHMVYLFKAFFPHIYYRYTSGAAASSMAELYDDSGVYAVALGMFFFGALLGISKRWLTLSGNALPVQLFYIVLPEFTIALMRGGIEAFLTSMGIASVPVVMLTLLTKRDSPENLPV